MWIEAYSRNTRTRVPDDHHHRQRRAPRDRPRIPAAQASRQGAAFSTSHGTAHVLYPEADAERCTAALLLEVDPGGAGAAGPGQGPRRRARTRRSRQYVNDRPYAASSLLAVALQQRLLQRDEGAVHGTARAAGAGAAAAHRGARAARPRRRRAGARALRAAGLDGARPSRCRWTSSSRSGATRATYGSYWRGSCGSPRRCGICTCCCRCSTTPSTTGSPRTRSTSCCGPARAGWPSHPEQQLITSRYLARRWSLTRAGDGAAGTGAAGRGGRHRGRGDRQRGGRGDGHRGEAGAARRAAAGGDPRGAARGRARAGCSTSAADRASWCRRCSRTRRFTEIVGVDVSMRALHESPRAGCGWTGWASGRRRASSSSRARSRTPTAGSRGMTRPCSARSIEHVDLPRLPALEYAVFGAARPRTVVVTTPNVEYNVRWESLPGRARPPRATTASSGRGRSSGAGRGRWPNGTATSVEFVPVGPDDPEVGPPTQMAVFTGHRDRGRPSDNRDTTDRHDRPSTTAPTTTTKEAKAA